MKHSFTLFILALCLSFPASSIKVLFDYRVFHIPGQGPYVEFVTAFETLSMKPVPAPNGGEQFFAELTIVLSQNNAVIDFRKVNMSSDISENGDTSPFLSLERFMLANGTYDLELTARDLSDEASAGETYRQTIVINNLSDGAFISDIQFVSAYSAAEEVTAFTKSGYDLIPYISSYYPSELNTLIYYAEIYQTDNYFGVDQPFVSSVCITDALNNEVAECKRIKREKAAPVVPLLQVMDIRNLPTGDYKIRVEVRDRENQMVCSEERRFSRNLIAAVAADPLLVSDELLKASFAGQYTNADSLYQIIQSHHPIARNVERNTIDYQLAGSDLRMMQSFFYSFWLRRNPESPEAGWRAYEKNLAKVEASFGTRIKKGWQTDRGRVYLRYGAPNTQVVRHHDPDYWPFEIWHYYQTNTGLRDRRFLFYNTTLNNDFELLHSDVPDEVQNNDWRRLVRARESNRPVDVGRNASNQTTDPYSGDEIEDLWYNPH